MKQPIIVRSALTLGFVSVILFAGCLMTKVTLIDPAAAKVNLAFVGNWDNPEKFDSAGREAGMIIRNLDGKQYYVEWDLKGEESKLTRAVGFTAEVRGVTFAHLRGLEEDGKLDETWLICRVGVQGNTISIRQLSEDFFKSKSVDTPAALRAVIEQNLENEAMYDKDILTATKK